MGLERIHCHADEPEAARFARLHRGNGGGHPRAAGRTASVSVNVARGLVLLFGIGTKALPSWDSKTRWNNLLGGLAVSLTGGPSGHAISPHPSSREGHHSTARWSSSFLLSHLMLHSFHAAAVACSRVQRNSVPSTHMRCRITARR